MRDSSSLPRSSMVLKMPSAGGQVPTHDGRAGFGERLGDGEAEAAVVGDAGDERALSAEIDGEHGAHDRSRAAQCQARARVLLVVAVRAQPLDGVERLVLLAPANVRLGAATGACSAPACGRARSMRCSSTATSGWRRLARAVALAMVCSGVGEIAYGQERARQLFRCCRFVHLLDQAALEVVAARGEDEQHDAEGGEDARRPRLAAREHRALGRRPQEPLQDGGAGVERDVDDTDGDLRRQEAHGRRRACSPGTAPSDDRLSPNARSSSDSMMTMARVLMVKTTAAALRVGACAATRASR